MLIRSIGVAWIMATAGVSLAQEGQPGPAITVYSSGLDAMMADPKDRALLTAVRMFRQRIAELPGEVGADPELTPAFEALWDAMTGPMALRVDVVQPAPGGPPFAAQLNVLPGDAAEAARWTGRVEGMLKAMGAPVQAGPAQSAGVDVPGDWRVLPSPAGLIHFGVPTNEPGAGFLVAFGDDVDTARPVPTMAELPAGVQPVLSAHIDCGKLAPFMEMMVQQAGPGGEGLRGALTAVGAMGEKPLVIDAAMGQGEDRTFGRARIRGYRSHAVGMAAGVAIGDETFSLIPEDATNVQASVLDVSGIADMLAKMSDSAADGGENPLEVFATEFRKNLGIDPRKDIIDHLGNRIVVYQSDSTGGGGFLSTVVVLELKDARGFADAHEKVRARINQLAAPETKGRFTIRSWQEAGVTIFSANTPGLPIPLEISWAIKGERLYAAASARGLLQAMAQEGSQRSFRSNPLLAEMRGAKSSITSLTYLDVPRFARQGYGVANLLTAAVANAVRSPTDGSRQPGLIMPTFAEFTRGARATMSISYWDGEDLVVESQGDRSVLVSMASMSGMGGGGTGAAAAAMSVGVLLPALGKARQTAMEIKSAAQLRSVSMAYNMFAADHQDQLPKSIKDLEPYLGDAESAAAMLSSPFGPMPDGRGDYGLRFSLDSIGKIARPDRTVIAVDLAAYATARGRIAVAFLDGHVETVLPSDLDSLLADDANKAAAAELVGGR